MVCWHHFSIGGTECLDCVAVSVGVALEPIWSYERTVLGHLASKSNSRRKTNWGGVIKSESAMQFCDDFDKQVPMARQACLLPVKMTVTIWYQDARRDLDVSLLQDCIQKRGIIGNDRQIVEIHAFRLVDRKKPRVHFRLDALPSYKAE